MTQSPVGVLALARRSGSLTCLGGAPGGAPLVAGPARRSPTAGLAQLPLFLLMWSVMVLMAGRAAAEPPLDEPPVPGGLDLAPPPAAASLGDPPVGTVEVVGARAVEEVFIRGVIGRPPTRAAGAEAWALRAKARIVAVYRRRGFAYARVFHVVTPAGGVALEIDEGVMDSVIFHGTSVYNSARYRVVLQLPFKTFNTAVVTDALEELETKFGLTGASFRVDESDDGVVTALGFLAPTRTLHIFSVSTESFGFNFAARLRPTYGFLPEAEMRLRDAIGEGDRLMLHLELGVPYRRYLFDADPKFQWVHGRFDVGYRFPPFSGGVVAAAIDQSTAVSDDARAEISDSAYYVLRTGATVSLALILPPLQASVGVGVRYNLLFDLTPRDAPDPDARVSVLRYGLALSTTYLFTPKVARRDLRSNLTFAAFVATDGEPAFFVDLHLTGQGAWRFGYHDLILRGEVLYVAGDVTLVDEPQLASDFQRVTFGGRFWVRAAITVELAARFSLYKDRVKLGIFNDLSFFGDRQAGGNLPAVAESFGPSLHFLLFDELGLDIYYGFGFSGDSLEDFDHNLSFGLVTVF